MSKAPDSRVPSNHRCKQKTRDRKTVCNFDVNIRFFFFFYMTRKNQWENVTLVRFSFRDLDVFACVSGISRV